MPTAQWSTKQDFKFSAGPWNLHSGADPFGPPVRGERSFAQKLKIFKDLGFDYVQFHDDDAVPDEFSATERETKAREVRKMLDDHGLKAEIFAPRHWEHAHGIDGQATTLHGDGLNLSAGGGVGGTSGQGGKAGAGGGAGGAGGTTSPSGTTGTPGRPGGPGSPGHGGTPGAGGHGTHGSGGTGGIGGTVAGGAQDGAAGTDGYASLTVCAAAKASA